MEISKKFSFKIPTRNNDIVFTAQYVDKLGFGDKCDLGKKGYHIYWGNALHIKRGNFGYLVKDVEYCVQNGIWTIVEEEKENK